MIAPHQFVLCLRLRQPAFGAQPVHPLRQQQARGLVFGISQLQARNLAAEPADFPVQPRLARQAHAAAELAFIFMELRPVAHAPLLRHHAEGQLMRAGGKTARLGIGARGAGARGQHLRMRGDGLQDRRFGRQVAGIIRAGKDRAGGREAASQRQQQRQTLHASLPERSTTSHHQVTSGWGS